MSDASAPPRVRLIGLPTDSHSSFLRGAGGVTATLAAKLVRELASLTAKDA